MSDSRMIRSSSPSSLTSLPDHLPKRMMSPSLTSSGATSPLSFLEPAPAATTMPCCGFSCAVSGRIIEQNVKFIGKEEIKIGEKTYKTLRFNFSSSDQSLSKDKKLNTDIWYEEGTFLWVKAAFDKTGYWEYRLKKVK